MLGFTFKKKKIRNLDSQKATWCVLLGSGALFWQAGIQALDRAHIYIEKKKKERNEGRKAGRREEKGKKILAFFWLCGWQRQREWTSVSSQIAKSTEQVPGLPGLYKDKSYFEVQQNKAEKVLAFILEMSLPSSTIAYRN